MREKQPTQLKDFIENCLEACVYEDGIEGYELVNNIHQQYYGFCRAMNTLPEHLDDLLDRICKHFGGNVRVENEPMTRAVRGVSLTTHNLKGCTNAVCECHTYFEIDNNRFLGHALCPKCFEKQYPNHAKKE